MREDHAVSDTLDANKALVRRLIEEGFNRGDLDAVDEIVSPDVVTHDPIILDAPSGADSIRGGIEMIHRAFSDVEVRILDMVAEGDRVVTFLRMSGVNTGDYRRGGATGKPVSFRAFFIWRVRDGLLVENWGVADRFDALQQLGIIPSDDELARRMPARAGD
jgi:predicted ester cyclase